jgi:hypothetical protein
VSIKQRSSVGLWAHPYIVAYIYAHSIIYSSLAPDCFRPLSFSCCLQSLMFSLLFMILVFSLHVFLHSPICSCNVIFSCHFMIIVFSHHVFLHFLVLLLSRKISLSLYDFCLFPSCFYITPRFCSYPEIFSCHVFDFCLSNHVFPSLPHSVPVL